MYVGVGVCVCTRAYTCVDVCVRVCTHVCVRMRVRVRVRVCISGWAWGWGAGAGVGAGGGHPFPCSCSAKSPGRLCTARRRSLGFPLMFLGSCSTSRVSLLRWRRGSGAEDEDIAAAVVDARCHAPRLLFRARRMPRSRNPLRRTRRSVRQRVEPLRTRRAASWLAGLRRPSTHSRALLRRPSASADSPPARGVCQGLGGLLPRGSWCGRRARSLARASPEGSSAPTGCSVAFRPRALASYAIGSSPPSVAMVIVSTDPGASGQFGLLQASLRWLGSAHRPSWPDGAYLGRGRPAGQPCLRWEGSR